MTISQAISRVDDLRHNVYSHQDKIRWISTLEHTVVRQVLQEHEGGEINFDGYTPEKDMQTQLMVKAPYDDIYIRWMEAMIDYHNGEIASYNGAIALFNAAFDNFKAWYTRTHMPLQKGRRFLF